VSNEPLPGHSVPGVPADDASFDWRHSARCRNEDPETLFVQGAQQRDAREVCKGCPVRTECLAHALDNRVRFGVWGGMTERERRALLKRRPDVISWAALLESARRAAEASPPADPAARTTPRRTASPRPGERTADRPAEAPRRAPGRREAG
jgi:WhiB family transcriptional regulator, redox-sensing transcriptional regulator